MPESNVLSISNTPLTPTALLVLGFFFLNTFLLPAGLLYTTLLTPVFALHLIRRGHWKPLLVYGLFSGIFVIFHLRGGAESAVYFKSYLLFSSVVIFTIWAAVVLRDRHEQLPAHFNLLVIYNCFLTIVAIGAFFVPVMRLTFWSFEPIHRALPVIPRLQMLVYEPSFYSFLLAPLILYYFTAAVVAGNRRAYLGLQLLLFSLLLSLSFGVIGGLVLTIAGVLLLNWKLLFLNRRVFLTFFYLALFAILILLALVEFFPHNPVVDRAGKVLQGHDSSANGRTWEAFLLAWRILSETDYLFGAGLGQVKIVGHQIIVDYYNYEGRFADLVRIPNIMAETLATFGVIGFVLRFLAQVILFIYTKVYENVYRMFLFAFLFLYQFTGSYLTNIYDYLAWVIVFLPVFPEFNKKVLTR